MDQRNLLLISNSTLYGSGYLDHCEDHIRILLGARKNVLFVPYARPSGMSWEEYTVKARERFATMGFNLVGIQDKSSPREAVRDAEAIFIGGGNTWQLLKTLKEEGLLYHIREAVAKGVPYIGTSAGSNVAGLTIGNTNDMPAAESHGRDALGLVPFNINPHYQDMVTLDATQREAVLQIAPQLIILIDHQGETRDTRLKEYQALGNLETIVALREGAMLSILEDHITLRGTTGAKIFIPGKEPTEHQPGEHLDFLLQGSSYN